MIRASSIGLIKRIGIRPQSLIQPVKYTHYNVFKSHLIIQPNVRTIVTKPKTSTPRSKIQKMSEFIREQTFRKKLTWSLIAVYLVLFGYTFIYMKKSFIKERELARLLTKKEKQGLSEDEEIEYKELLGEKVHKRKKVKVEKIDEKGNSTVVEVVDTSYLDAIPKPSDTTVKFEQMGAEYDNIINMDERIMFMGSKRRNLVSNLTGDVLEVSCGTGRNLKYIDLKRLDSITFLDSSRKMVEVTMKKFTDRFIGYKKVAFVVGKAEELPKLTGLDEKGNPKIKYDTIFESFGLCCHEDPVEALKNFEKILKPGGRIILLEHGRGTYDFINKILDRRAEKHAEKFGCRWNLEIGEIIDDSGLEVVSMKRANLGTTWHIVAKRKNDPKKYEEYTFFEKYITPPSATTNTNEKN